MKKGAFSGASQRREGRFSTSKWWGLFFLDEIGDMPAEAQNKDCCECSLTGNFYLVGGLHTNKS